MSTELITGNDLKSILNEVLPPTPSEYKELLWTNPSLSSGSAAFDLAFANEYDAYEIIFSMDNGGYLFLPSVLVVAGNSPCGADFTHTNGGRYYRSVTLNGATLSFTTGYYNGTANVNACVPYKIYGIKYERVAPPQADALEWKLAGTATGNTNTVTVPSSAQEISVAIGVTSGVCYTGTAPIVALKAVWNVSGYYFTSTDIGLCNLNVSNGNRTFQIRNCRYGSGDYKTTAILSVYYR